MALAQMWVSFRIDEATCTVLGVSGLESGADCAVAKTAKRLEDVFRDAHRELCFKLVDLDVSCRGAERKML